MLNGNVTFLDDKYDEILTICSKLGLVIPKRESKHLCDADFHGTFETESDTLLVSAYNVNPADLSAIEGAKDGWIFHCLVFELESESEKILFQ